MLVGAQPYQGKKKGADTGIDGVIYFSDEKGPAKKIIGVEAPCYPRVAYRAADPALKPGGGMQFREWL